MRWVENVRNKPYSEKVRIIKIVLAISAIVLIGIWVTLEQLDGKDVSEFEAVEKLNSEFEEVKNNYR